MKKTIGLLAHVDAGKTTFSEQLLYHTHSIKERGRVDHQNAFLDSHNIERQRGITVFADQGMSTYNGTDYYFIDTPGHADFSAEMERAIQVMDYAVVIISAVEGIEGHTETVWQLLRKHQVPTFIFINKMDRVGADLTRVLQDIRNLSENVYDLSEQNLEQEMNEELIEWLAERDEKLLDTYMESGYNNKLWLSTLKELVNKSQIFPCFSGSALQDQGITHFLSVLDKLTITNYQEQETAPFSGRVYKIRHDEKGTRLTFIKALSGNLKVRDELVYGPKDNTVKEKITQIRVYNGEKYNTKDQVAAGELFAVTGLSITEIGEGLGTLQDRRAYEMIPTLQSKVILHSKIHIKEALAFFNLLNAEDPSLNVIWDEELQEIHIHVMGTVQLEVLQQIAKERFQLDVSFGPPEIIYKETIQTPVIGYGHFEPLRHYAEVHLKIEPGPRNSGVLLENACHTDDLSSGNQNLILRHLDEREHHGLLTGSALTDVKLTLLTGAAHNKHTHGGDFREAAFRAVRQGLEKAENILLEPYYHFKIKVALDHMGRVLQDIQMAHGVFDTPVTENDHVFIAGRAPVATFMSYSTELASFTQGRGSITMMYAGYAPCHNSEEVIEIRGYRKEADPKYTSSSIFCSKGQSFSVPWHKAEAYMHLI